MIYDITQPLFGCEIYPGDTEPQMIPVRRISDGETYNLTDLMMCVHNGTHIDAPFHFINDGKTVDQISLDKFVGKAYVVSHDGELTAEAAGNMVKAAYDNNARKILIKGEAVISLEAARVFAAAKADLLGIETQSTGPDDQVMRVHVELLKAEVVILEGIRLNAVNDGFYLLNCAPLNLQGCDGSPCRAILMDI